MTTTDANIFFNRFSNTENTIELIRGKVILELIKNVIVWTKKVNIQN
jgi:hypothetical protein